MGSWNLGHVNCEKKKVVIIMVSSGAMGKVAVSKVAQNYESRRAGSLEIAPGHGASVGNRGRGYWPLVCPQVSYIFIRGGGSARESVCSQVDKTQKSSGKYYSETSSPWQSFLSFQSREGWDHASSIPPHKGNQSRGVPSQRVPKSTPSYPAPCPWLRPDAPLPGLS